MPGLNTQSNGGSLQLSTLATINTLAASIFPSQGNQYFVNPGPGLGSDVSGDGSRNNPLASLGAALALCTAGQNDIVFLCAHSNTAAQTTNYLTSNLNWNKDLVHLIGINAGPLLGQRSRISNDAASAVISPLFTLSANGCLLANLEFFQGLPASGTTSICVLVSGQRNVIDNCQISGNGDLTGVVDVAGSRSLKLSGSENLFRHCYIGLDTVLRATQTTEVEISAGARNTFERCHFETYTSLSTFKMVTVATGCDRFVKFTDCDFHAVQNITSAVAPTGCIGITTMNGEVIMRNPYLYGFAQYVTADNAYVQMLGLNGLATGHLVGIAQGVDAA